MEIEIIPIIVNATCAGYYAYAGGAPFKVLYWIGATILAFGLYGMKG